MPAFVDVTNKRYGRLTVLGRAPNRRKMTYWLCLCDCGAKTEVSKANLGLCTFSCGCLQRERTGIAARICNVTHGKSKTLEYKSWSHMIQRCCDPNATGYNRYGGAGISVCDRWRHSFEAFLLDMGPRPTVTYSLDRWPNAFGNYEPSNCRWATKMEQTHNRRPRKQKKGLSA